MMGVGSAVVSAGLGTGLTGCSPEELQPADFKHGVASGDPLHDRVILWTRVTPEQSSVEKLRVFWEVAEDENFSHKVVSGSALTTIERDFTIKVDAHGLAPSKRYFYRFKTINSTSAVGRTKTLPIGYTEQVNMAVLSCSNYPAGYFHVYAEVAKQTELDVAIHLGDYLYEYGRDGYASEDAAELDRLVEPETEIVTLADYRARYQQYRGDRDLQLFHQSLPVIVVWDDHEVANDAWREGAENHDEATQGSYIDRLMAALQAYAEWMPIRPPVDTDISTLARSFKFGDLVNLSMLDTRIVGRDRQLSLSNYFKADGSFDAATYFDAINDPKRTLLGQEQLNWLQGELSTTATWQVLGQQVLMGKMELPGAVATAQLSIPEFAELARIAQIGQTNPELLSPEELQLLQEKGALLLLPNLPYNLDAWDGYPVERDMILNTANENGANLVVLAGDTHNAWANNIRLEETPVGVELATASVTSPGLEAFLGLDSLEAAVQTELGLVQLIDGLQYTNLKDRGYLKVTFTHAAVNAEWQYVNSVKEVEYERLESRAFVAQLPAGANSF